MQAVSNEWNKRRDLRVRTRFESLYSSGREEGAGVLADISYSGALMEGTSLKPELGTRLRVYVFLRPIDPFELVGQVVRHTENGFAIEYDEEPAEDLRRFVDDASAMVAAPDPVPAD